MRKVKLQNERHGQLDLSAVCDEDGKPVVLQPRGSANGRDARVCNEDALDHPHVQTFLGQSPPWLSYTLLATAPARRVPSVKEVTDAGYATNVAEGIVAREQRIADLIAAGMPAEEAVRQQAEEAQAEPAPAEPAPAKPVLVEPAPAPAEPVLVEPAPTSNTSPRKRRS